jgi:hypothetical protein
MMDKVNAAKAVALRQMAVPVADGYLCLRVQQVRQSTVPPTKHALILSLLLRPQSIETGSAQCVSHALMPAECALIDKSLH